MMVRIVRSIVWVLVHALRPCTKYQNKSMGTGRLRRLPHTRMLDLTSLVFRGPKAVRMHVSTAIFVTVTKTATPQMIDIG